jgi:hypothetical protein
VLAIGCRRMVADLGSSRLWRRVPIFNGYNLHYR